MKLSCPQQMCKHRGKPCCSKCFENKSASLPDGNYYKVKSDGA